MKNKTIEEKDSFEILLDYAKKNNLKHHYYRQASKHLIAGGQIAAGNKFIYFEKDDFVFYASDAPMLSNTRTGLYTNINLADNFECKISIKNFLNLLFTKNKKKTGIKQLDELITISSKSDLENNFAISRESVERFQEINKQFTALEIIIENDYLNKFEEMKGKKILGLRIKEWIYKHEDIDLFIEKGKELLNSILKDNKQAIKTK